ncbi:hypothetical protein DDE18_12405 [Nocardioides gansuensis]|uniref:Iron-containing redox enzyme family protein n=1 Tax=Nocardioides gansuensis TaxID=2138300 RepID=A0A2T8F981_9ACTN|nr:iron-containing redox enzyme family protein [Nocardioides gansuensis]PVG82291.1 hypothetical protein DDE18_12405 [Nocardioides gansuensis]
MSGPHRPRLPAPRGPLGELVLPGLLSPAAEGPLPIDNVRDVAAAGPDADDLHLVLWCLHHLHVDGFADVDPAWEWAPSRVAVWGLLADHVEAELRLATAELVEEALAADGPVPDRLFAMVDGFGGASVASYLRKDGTAEQFLELLVHRSAYNLRESDPQALVLPRLTGAAQSALAELLYDEYGAGDPGRHHSGLYARAMTACGLSAAVGDYLRRLPGTTLVVPNTMHVLGLQRRLAPAAMGHFGVFEATSSGPSRLLARAAERLGLPREVFDYYDEHVEADAVHEQLVFRSICGSLADTDPACVPELFFGAAACLVVEDAAGRALLHAWEAGRSSLLDDGDNEQVAV